MNPKQILEAYINEYYIRDEISITYEYDSHARLEFPDRIIHLICDERGIVSTKTHKRRGIPFADNPVGIKVQMRQVTMQDVPTETPEGVNGDFEEDFEEVFVLPVRAPRNDFKEGDVVCSIYNRQQTFKVERQDDNIVYIFDKKTSSSHIAATADVEAVQVY